MSSRILGVLILASCLMLAVRRPLAGQDPLSEPTASAAGGVPVGGADAGQLRVGEAPVAESPAEAPAAAAEEPAAETPDSPATEPADRPGRILVEPLEVTPWSEPHDWRSWRPEFRPSYPPPTFFSPDMGPPGRTRGILGSAFSPQEYYLGISLESVDDTLRSQLKLPSEVGIVVAAVGPNSPAELAGLKTHDVLTHADDQPITRIDGLIKAVQQAGSEQRELTLALIRAGESQTVSLKPIKRSGNERVFRWQPDGSSLREVPESVPAQPPTSDRVSVVPTPRQRLNEWMQDQTRAQDELKQQVEQLRRDIDELRKMFEDRQRTE